MDKKSSASLRWITLFIIILNIAFNYFYMALIDQPSMGQVSGKYPSLFTPAGYAFSIWGLIYCSFLFFCIVQLKRTRLEKTAYNRLSVPLLISNVLAALWIVVFTKEMFTLSVVIMSILLLLSVRMFGAAASAYFRHRHNWWIQLPFSLFCGWLSVAFLANLAVLIASEQGKENEVLTLLFIALAVIAAMLVGIRFRNPVYPLVVAWAVFAIWIARKGDHPGVAYTALAASLLSILACFAALYRLKSSPSLRR
ncbi:hypothetical protein [Arcticibacter sp. MXS-1]|uniref:hypothetical protein n=1 Tax=Arcticibacter sp. MXS-1 TaxID=3341726 RepID=UPI0035A8F29E